ncbi:MAG TPA: NUDIX hydrolase [Thermoanaerobaculia bacterium]|nr:NUDIX hydrolase [Thermoanaerobaculia bacterium]
MAILAITDDKKIVLTEQFRAPVQYGVVDLPAGLIEEYGPEETARRELEEETGFTCDEAVLLTSCATSPGITSEIVHFYRAKGVRKIGPGGGVDGEKIRVHVTPLDGIDRWLREMALDWNVIDVKVWVGLHFASQST